MTFPENEYSSIIDRLNQGKLCYTPYQREEIYQYSEKVDKSYELIAFKLSEK